MVKMKLVCFQTIIEKNKDDERSFYHEIGNWHWRKYHLNMHQFIPGTQIHSLIYSTLLKKIQTIETIRTPNR